MIRVDDVQIAVPSVNEVQPNLGVQLLRQSVPLEESIRHGARGDGYADADPLQVGREGAVRQPDIVELIVTRERQVR